MTTTYTRGLLGGAAAMLAAGAIAGCAPSSDPALMSTVQDCATTGPFGQTIRVDDAWCAGGHPGAFPVYSSIYSDGFYSPGWGAPLIGWNRQRPYNYSPTTVIVNSNRTGGTINRVGTGSGVSSSTKTGSGSLPKYSQAASSKYSSPSSASASRGTPAKSSSSSASSKSSSSGKSGK